MKNLLSCLVLAFLAVSTSGTKFTDCGSVSGSVISLSVTNCPDNVDECPLVKGTQSNITISFTSSTDTKSIKAVVHGIIGGVPLPFNLPQPDGCKSGVDCPVKNGQNCVYSNLLDIRRSYPPFAVKVKYELQDEKGTDLVCLEINCKITSSIRSVP